MNDGREAEAALVEAAVDGMARLGGAGATDAVDEFQLVRPIRAERVIAAKYRQAERPPRPGKELRVDNAKNVSLARLQRIDEDACVATRTDQDKRQRHRHPLLAAFGSDFGFDVVASASALGKS